MNTFAPEVIMLEKIRNAGLDVLIKIFRQEYRSGITNMKNTKIPLHLRRDLIKTALLQAIGKEAEKIAEAQAITQGAALDIVGAKILETYFPIKQAVTMEPMEWVNEFTVGEIVLLNGASRICNRLCNVVKINKKSLTLRMYAYTRITNQHLIRNQTHGYEDMVWNMECLEEHKYVIFDRRKIYKHGDDGGIYDCEFQEGKMAVDYGY